MLRSFPIFRLIGDFASMKTACAFVEKTSPDLLICHEETSVPDVLLNKNDAKTHPAYLILAHDPAVGVRALEKGAVFLQYPLTPEKMAVALWRVYENLFLKKQ